MKKKLALTGIVVWGIISVCIIGIIISVVMNGGIRMFGESIIVKQERIDLAGINNLEIESESCKIEMRATTSPEIMVTQYGGRSLNKKEVFEASVSGEKLKIKQEYLFRFIGLNFNFNQKLVIEVPEDWVGNVTVKNTSGGITIKDSFVFQDVKIKNSSGGIHIDDGLTAENLSLDVTSGGMHLEGNITVNHDINMKSSSGGIKAEAVTGAENLVVKTTSGGIKLGKMEVKTYDIHCSSGGVKAEYLTGGGKIKTSSGGITVKLDKLSEDVDIRASSGGVKVYVDNDEAFSFSGKCSSGTIKADFPMNINDGKSKATAEVGADPSVLIQVKTSSGGIRMYQE